ncbi:MAG: CPBP family intramembrane metalloprotease [Candidatus Omnitrophica bacterium]|nr:CPBP family intramembrane metalloprotease [Candidatus Omnitrophota bacterium]
MLSFILLFNAWFILAQKIPEMKEGLAGKRIFRLQQDEKEAGFKFIPKADQELSLSWSKILEKKGYLPFLVNILGFGVLFVFSLGLFLDVRILMAKVRKRQVFRGCGKHLPARWGIWDIFKLAIIFVFLGYILYIIEALFFPCAPQRNGGLRFIPLLNAGIMDLALFGFIVYFVKVKYRQALSAIGLEIKDAVRNIFLATTGYIAFLPILAFLLLLLIIITTIFNYHPPQHTLFNLFLQEREPWILIYSTIMVVILGPIVEEAFFRGFAYNAIKRKWGTSKAALLTAVVFAGLHGTLIGFLPIMALGLLLVYMYEKTGSLVSSITIHILHNGIMVGLLFLARHLIRFAH